MTTNDGVYQCCGIFVFNDLGCDWRADLQRLETVTVNADSLIRSSSKTLGFVEKVTPLLI